MKKSFLSLLLITFVQLFMGCTLYMDEIPEERRGIDEPYTMSDSIINLTYQYNEGVRPVTSKMKEYFVALEADSIIYFTDNMPSEMLPEPGEYVAAGCSRQFPKGLNDRVLSVDRTNGMYKIVVTKASMDEVYKELEYELTLPYTVPDVTYMVDPEAEDDSTFTYTDWSMVDRANGVSEEEIQRNYTRALHRPTREIAGPDDTQAEDNDTTKSFSFSFDSRIYKTNDKEGAIWKNVIHKAFTESIKTYVDLAPFISLSGSITKDITFHEVVSKRRDYHESSRKEKTTQELKFFVGVGGSYSLGYKKVKEFENAIKEAKKVDKKLFSFMSAKIQNVFKPVNGKIVVPVCTVVPVTIDISFSAELKFNLSGAVGISYRNITYEESGSIQEKGKTRKIGTKDGKPRTLPLTEAEKKSCGWDFFMMGSATVSFTATLGVGITALKCSSTTIAANVEAGIAGKYMFVPTSESSMLHDSNTGINYWVKFYATVNFDVSLLGISLWDQTITFLEHYFVNKTFNPFAPNFEISNNAAFIIDGKFEYTFTMSNNQYLGDDGYGAMAIFKRKKGTKNAEPTLVTTYTNKNKIFTGKSNIEYTFTGEIDNYDPTYDYLMAPGIEALLEEEVHIFTDKMCAAYIAAARGLFENFRQTMGEELYVSSNIAEREAATSYYDVYNNMSNIDDGKQPLYKYGFAFTLRLGYRAYMKDVYFDIKIATPRDTQNSTSSSTSQGSKYIYLIDRRVYLTNKAKKSDEYTFNYYFTTNTNSKFMILLEPKFTTIVDGKEVEYEIPGWGEQALPPYYLNLTFPFKAVNLPKGTISSSL